MKINKKENLKSDIYKIYSFFNEQTDIALISFEDSYFLIFKNRNNKIKVYSRLFGKLRKINGYKTKNGYRLYSKKSMININFKKEANVKKIRIDELESYLQISGKCHVIIRNIEEKQADFKLDGEFRIIKNNDF